MREPKEDRDMTPEQIKRIVKVLNTIGWPTSFYFDGHYWLHEFNGLNIDAVVLAGNHFRQWLKKHWDEVESHCTNGVVALELVRYNPPGESCYHAEVVINTEGETDELELYLTAVERTLEQEASNG